MGNFVEMKYLERKVSCEPLDLRISIDQRPCNNTMRTLSNYKEMIIAMVKLMSLTHEMDYLEIVCKLFGHTTICMCLVVALYNDALHSLTHTHVSNI